MQQVFRPLEPNKVKLLPSPFLHRYNLNRRYVLSLSNDNLLQNYYLEAGLWGPRDRAGRRASLGLGDPHLPGARPLPRPLALGRRAASTPPPATPRSRPRPTPSSPNWPAARRRTAANGSAPIPQKYLDWIARGKRVWAPHYTLHKTLMGLYDMYALAGNEQALEILRQVGRAGSTAGPASSPASRWTTSSTSRPAACSRCGPTSTASRASQAHLRPDRALRPPAPLRPAAGGRGRAHQHARQHHHPRGARRRPRLGGDRRAALARRSSRPTGSRP